LRRHQGAPDDPAYPLCDPHTFDVHLKGADLVLAPDGILKRYPFISHRAAAMLHVRRCGWLSAQQLGMYLLTSAKTHGTKFLKGRLSGASVRSNRIESVSVLTGDGPRQIETRCLVIAAGPLLKSAAAMIGVDVPVFNELHSRIAINDPLGVVPRDAPLMIWQDPVSLYWSEEERKTLAQDDDTRWLLDPFPAGVHFRPEGGAESRSLLGIWTYDTAVCEPVFPPVFREDHGEIVMRGLARMVPKLAVTLDKMSRPVVDGGYYCKTRENRPLIGPLPVNGAYVIGALSGFGIMAAMAAGDLLASHVAGGTLPDEASAFLLSRYEDPQYRRLLDEWDATSGQL